MIVGNSEIQAFAMGYSQAAVASRDVNVHTIQPSVQIISIAGGINVSGADALYALIEACQFALRQSAQHATE